MSHAHILTMKRPHEALGLPVPIGRRLTNLGKGSWVIFLGSLSVFCVGLYVFQISQTAAKGYALRDLEKQQEYLQESVSALEAQAAELQSMNALQERVKGLGYVPVQHMEYVDVNNHAYALAK